MTIKDNQVYFPTDEIGKLIKKSGFVEKKHVCPVHGETTELCRPDEEPNCSLCRIEDEKKNYAKIVDYESMRIPLGFRKEMRLSYRNEEEKEIIEFCKSYRKEMNIILCGGYGVGKTTLACRMLAKNGAGIYEKPFQFLKKIEKAKVEFRSYLDVVAPLYQADLLVLDECGREGAAEQKLIFDIISARHDSGKKTIFATNLTKPQIVEFLGGGVVDRLKPLKIIEMKGGSRR